MSCRSIKINCPICPNENQLESPEILCGHMAQFHDIHTVMQSKNFESFAYFQMWLSMIEETRCDGGYLGSSQGPFYEDEYYLLCRRTANTNAKRRRMSEEVSSSNEAASIVSCTAFVHVFERMDGRITVRYCLDHCGHSDNNNSITNEEKDHRTIHLNRKRSTLKRSSPCSTFEKCNETCSCEYQSSSSIASSPSSSIDFDIIDEDDSTDHFIDDSFTVTNLNLLISQRLDSTADRLKTLTKVLADLAVDIRNSDYHITI